MSFYSIKLCTYIMNEIKYKNNTNNFITNFYSILSYVMSCCTTPMIIKYIDVSINFSKIMKIYYFNHKNS